MYGSIDNVYKRNYLVLSNSSRRNGSCTTGKRKDKS